MKSMKFKQVNPRPVDLVAMLLIRNGQLYGGERGREVSRHRFGLSTLRKIGRCRHIDDAYLKELSGALFEHQWHLLRLENDYAIFNITNAHKWVKLSSKRLDIQSYLEMDDEELHEELTDPQWPFSLDSDVDLNPDHDPDLDDDD